MYNPRMKVKGSRGKSKNAPKKQPKKSKKGAAKVSKKRTDQTVQREVKKKAKATFATFVTACKDAQEECKQSYARAGLSGSFIPFGDEEVFDPDESVRYNNDAFVTALKKAIRTPKCVRDE